MPKEQPEQYVWQLQSKETSINGTTTIVRENVFRFFWKAKKRDLLRFFNHMSKKRKSIFTWICRIFHIWYTDDEISTIFDVRYLPAIIRSESNKCFTILCKWRMKHDMTGLFLNTCWIICCFSLFHNLIALVYEVTTEQSQEWKYVVILEQKGTSTAKMQCCFCDKVFTGGALRIVRENVFFRFFKSKKRDFLRFFCIASHVFSNYDNNNCLVYEFFCISKTLDYI